MCESYDKVSIKGMTLPDCFVRPVLWKGLTNRDGFVTEKPLEDMIDSAMQKKISVAVIRAVRAIEAMRKNAELMKALQIIRKGKGDKTSMEIICKEFDALEKELLVS